ncbi:Nucleotide-binding universal stress protein, UspA family [Halomicrobium zhouii]|uniref:Nucleotide-binding universal stress protein, UspA family n=1 Tax=Halomicrobium zhouii TaxID=767519 RepID=A0A1I6LJ61_9EURY|nr:universal stress protein [Halomicrobium zhouii]SFS03476.1 Nucleotide-binding universal stress protein, UspA family [Halomicrobium zhouii]
MYEILVPVDRDEPRALSQAETVSELPHSAEEVHVTLLHVFTNNEEGASVNQVGSVREAQERMAEAGIEVDLAEQSGDPAAEILDYADEADVDLICLAGRKRTPAGKVLFGSVTQSVILGTEKAVLVSGREQTPSE